MASFESPPFSTNPNAPKITYDVYFQEKANFAGILIASILYGIVIVLFFQCVAALFNSAHRRGKNSKWGLLSYITATFSVVTVLIAMQLNLQSISYIDNREYPGVDGVTPPGPLGYQESIHASALTVIPDLMFLLNGWMADALLLYRCYVLYSMNFWLVAFPCLMYFGSVAAGILLLIHQVQGPNSSLWYSAVTRFNLPYFSLSTAINVILTIAIAIRLLSHGGNIRAASGPAGIRGWYRTIVTFVIESSALNAANWLLFFVPWVAKNHASDIFLPILGQTQVLAPLLIIQRIANQNALTGDTVVTAQISEFKARSGGQLTAGSVMPGGDPMRSVHRNIHGKNNSGDLGVGVTTTINFAHDNDKV